MHECPWCPWQQPGGVSQREASIKCDRVAQADIIVMDATDDNDDHNDIDNDNDSEDMTVVRAVVGSHVCHYIRIMMMDNGDEYKCNS